ncbi:hypothetical protein PTTG_02877 [Puccinia triticina 1-1 BBBD Race 1]|uniref:Uncharacterized protein n=1 Tax=Puccinia triticina (isolate 1-1 / race 1 (BBBD)) TaxID=630390 RepID=A0A180H3E7_PUCT1|nr:hypothetical protein PTTG_02877 [Puccinia triticina 1-1 BBBD Race 1]
MQLGVLGRVSVLQHLPLTAGLKAIDLETTGLTKVKKSTLDYVPGLETIGEELELPNKANWFNPDVDEDGKDVDLDDDESESDTDTETPKAMKMNDVAQLNPAYWLSIFQVCFPDHHNYAQGLLQLHYDQRKLEEESKTGSKQVAPPAQSQPSTKH